MADLSTSACADDTTVRATEPSDLAVAIRVAQRTLDSGSTVALRESLRLVLRALDAEPATEEEKARRFVDRHFPEVAAFLAEPLYGGDVDEFTSDAYDSLADTDFDDEQDDEKGVELLPTPVGPGCGAAATARIEGYSPRGGVAHGSLDLAVYACAEHAAQARAEWLGDLRPHTMPLALPAKCGQQFDYTTLGGGQ
ncbi:hypothetical protein [Streptomyces canus]|uniref:hypothetical protein n=1 Tax=Streptomyces canus TaxID=58343 RepID=UPI0007496ABD|nr:hypothetical protein [Streptomyces canus]KUN12703.1 hypothetical protein AQI96_12995 [Streptomyces canus]